MKLQKTAESVLKNGRYCVAVSLDIQNGFNTMPWNRIVWALVDAKMSPTQYVMRVSRGVNGRKTRRVDQL